MKRILLIALLALAGCATRAPEPPATVALPPVTAIPSATPAPPPQQPTQPPVAPTTAAPSSAIRSVPTAYTAAQLRARVQREGRPVFADGNVFTFVYEGDVDRVTSCCSVQLPMTRLPGSNVWALSVEVRDLDRAVMSHGFYIRDEGRLLSDAGLTGEWRGPNAPPAPRVARPLTGRMLYFEFTSPALGEPRRVEVYFPPGYDPARRYAAIYMTDGGQLPRYAERYEALLLAGEVQPLLLIGLHASDLPERDGLPSGRWQEYLPSAQPGQQSERFALHAQFVTRELIPWAERELRASPNRQDRAAFGTSNGAVWAAAMGMQHADVFGTVMAFSMGVSPGTPAANSTPPRYYLSAGTLEEGFLRVTATHSSALQRVGITNTMTTRTSGHDIANWQDAWVDALRALFPAGREQKA